MPLKLRHPVTLWVNQTKSTLRIWIKQTKSLMYTNINNMHEQQITIMYTENNHYAWTRYHIEDQYSHKYKIFNILLILNFFFKHPQIKRITYIKFPHNKHKINFIIRITNKVNFYKEIFNQDILIKNSIFYFFYKEIFDQDILTKCTH